MHVTMRSPIPESPENVLMCAPSATPTRAISAIPRVMTAAFVLSPRSAPSMIPAAMAMTFLSEPPISTPRMSLLAYTRKYGSMNACCTRRAVSRSEEAATTVVGILRLTSSAWLGPESVAMLEGRRCGSVSWSISDIVMRVLFSTPLATLTTVRPAERRCFSLETTDRRNWEGTAPTIISAPSTDDSRSSSTRTACGMGIPGRKAGFSLVARMRSASSLR